MPSVSVFSARMIGHCSHFIPRELPNARVLPYENIWLTNNSAVACMNQCAAFGYPAAGVEVRP